jgi:tRNA A-37 threonylcarbamoyl transferase component Bud32
METYTKRITSKEFQIYKQVAEASLAPKIIHFTVENDLILLTTQKIAYTYGELAINKEQIEKYTEKWHQLLNKLHNLGIYHGDISEENVMFDENGKGYLIDFGLSGSLKDITQENVEQQLDEYHVIDLNKITASTPEEKVKQAEHLEVNWLQKQFEKKTFT